MSPVCGYLFSNQPQVRGTLLGTSIRNPDLFTSGCVLMDPNAERPRNKCEHLSPPQGSFHLFCVSRKPFACEIPFLEPAWGTSTRNQGLKVPTSAGKLRTRAFYFQRRKLWYSDVTGDSRRSKAAPDDTGTLLLRTRVTWRRWKDGCWGGGGTETSGTRQHWSPQSDLSFHWLVEAPTAATSGSMLEDRTSRRIPQQKEIILTLICGNPGGGARGGGARAAVTFSEVSPGLSCRSPAFTRLAS